MKKFLYLLLAAAAVSPMMAQTSTSGDISGTLSDPTGAVIPGAQITATSITTGEKKMGTSNATGSFRLSLLSPGTYKVTATASGFTTTQNMTTVSVGVITTDNLKLTVGQGSTTVEVTAAPEIVNTTNADVTTTFTAEQVASLPNPGNDLTFVAQTAPGSVMNTGTAAGGYGNFSSFGISALSNMFTLDGGYENDPFLNLNNTGASNLTLGNNEVDTVTVISPAFSAQYGGLGGAQVNEITASGGNHVHGNLNYYWDGRVLNANDYFNKQQEIQNGTQNIPTFVNANQYGAAIGGPILKDKLFFFINTEGIRATTPAQGTVYAPSPAAEACTRGQDPGGTRTIPMGAPGTKAQTITYASCANLNAAADTFGNADPNDASVGTLEGAGPFNQAAPGQLAQMNRVFATFDNSPYRPAASAVTPNPYDPATVTYFATSKENLTEYLITGRLDFHISDKDNFYIHYKEDKGTQPTYTDIISPLFTDLSLQPSYEGQVNETHSFTPNFTNQLVLTGNYYSAPFENSNPTAAVLAAAPSTAENLNGGFGNELYGGINYDFPQGRRVAGYQIIDDVSYTKGKNTIRWGYNFRRDNVTDIQGVETTFPISLGYEEDFLAGITDYEYVQRFPQRATQPVSVYNEGGYVEDTFKLSPTVTLIAGLRMEKNGNPVCHTNCFSVLFNPLPGSAAVSAPYNAAFAGGLIAAGRNNAFKTFEQIAFMPRLGMNYQVNSKTVVRAGFGMFVDTPPGVVADTVLSNVPNNFHAAIYGPYAGGASYVGYDNTVAGQASPVYGNIINGQQTATTSANVFHTDFYAGANETTVAADVAKANAHYSTPSVSTVAPQVNYPTYEEYSLAVERRLDNKTSLAITYVGNHGFDEPVSDGTNNLTNAAAGAAFFPTIPTAKSYASFATVTNIYSGASSNFNGIVLSATRRSRDLTIQFNYEFSKALDEISNGGLEPFAPDAGDSAALIVPGNLHANYGPADYNVKHNVTSSFVYELPTLFKGGSKFVRDLVGGFEFSGDIFHNSGLPYSVTQSTTSAGGGAGNGILNGFANGGVLLLARQTSSNFDHHCGGSSHVENVALGTVANPCGFKASFTAPSSFTTGQGRNSLIGPSYTNANIGAFKTFGLGIPYLEGAKLKLGAQMFNAFNHTNFQNPAHGRSSSNSLVGGISSTVGAPTSILGSTGGADASARLIQLHASLVF